MTQLETMLPSRTRPMPAAAKIIGGIRSAWRRRAAVSQLGGTLLSDVGLTPHQARTDVRQRRWDAPGYFFLR